MERAQEAEAGTPREAQSLTALLVMLITLAGLILPGPSLPEGGVGSPSGVLPVPEGLSLPRTLVSQADQVPPPSLYLEGGALPTLLADGQFVYGPNVAGFELPAYLALHSPALAPLAQDLEDKAAYYSLNPRLLLTLLEICSGAVGARAPLTRSQMDRIVGYEDIVGYEEQLFRLGDELVRAYYARLYGPRPEAGEPIALTLADGTVVSVPAETNAATLAVLTALAPLSSKTEWRALLSPDDPGGFLATYRRLFPDSDPLDDSNQVIPHSPPPASLLKLPYACQDTWWFTGGPHDSGGDCADGDPIYAIDFAPGVPYCTIPSNRWITSPADGTVTSVRCSGCLIKINHQDGWGSYFYHVANPQVTAGQTVVQDQHLGNPSTMPSCGGDCGGCGGSATGTHLHYGLLYNGAMAPIEGTTLQGWVVHGVGTCYQGYLEKGSLQKWVGSSVISDCTCPQSGGVILYWNKDYDCSNNRGDPGYRLRATIGWQNTAGAFNDKASSVRVPPGWSVKLYQHADCSGASVCRSEDDFNFAGDFFDGGSVPLDDNVSSFEVFSDSQCGVGRTEPVVLFQHLAYGGAQYGLAGVGAFNLPLYMNDIISSLRLAEGWSVRVFEHIDQQGGQACFSVSDADLSDDLFDNGLGVDNRISSVEVFDQPNCPGPPPPPLLNQPANGAVLTTTEELTLEWQSSPAATEYQAHLWLSPTVDLYSGWISETHWYVGPQPPGTYTWQVAARNQYGESGLSAPWTFTVVTAPLAAPAAFTATVLSASEVLLSWQGQDPAATDDHLERSADGSQDWQEIAVTPAGLTQTLYLDSGLECETTYAYRVRAHSSLDHRYSSYSPVVEATTAECPSCEPQFELTCGSSYGGRNDDPGSTDHLDRYPCTPEDESGPEYAYRFVSPALARVTIELGSAGLDLLVLDGGENLCRAKQCLAWGRSQVTFPALPGHPYIVVVDGPLGLTNSYTITVWCAEGFRLYVPVVWRQG